MKRREWMVIWVSLLVPICLIAIIMAMMPISELVSGMSESDKIQNEWRPEIGLKLPKKRAFILGIDISRYQGEIKWKSLQKANKKRKQPVEFVFIKASEGEKNTDPKFIDNKNGAKKAGLLVGAYHYFLADKDARTQALNFISQAKFEKGDLPPVVDIEENRGKSKHLIEENLQVFLDEVSYACNCNPIIYSNESFYRTYLESFKIQPYPIWIARYNTTAPSLKHLDFWQYTESGTVEGIQTPVDMNVFLDSLSVLKNLCINPSVSE